ncbi:AraC family transcriptional regulator [Paenibacillus sp. KN14-4R]|uniref:AraC family transcriptional regulator n=1 Tax=Paenibacillus sp. KN14-4R TaxID=3445773 RepID=UPI003FA01BFD
MKSEPYLTNRLSETINWIEANIRLEITLDDIASNAYLSKFYLHRVFKQATGLSLLEYVRSRKLALSLLDLIHTSLRISDIAQEYGFGHHQSYIRAFIREFGMTPTEFRNGAEPVKVVERFNIKDCYQVDDGLVFKPTYVVLPTFFVAGFRKTVYINDNIENQTANDYARTFYYEERPRIKNAIDPDTYIGLTWVPMCNSDFTYYTPSIRVKEGHPVPKGMLVERIPANKYAVFKYIGNHHPNEISSKTLKTIWEYIYGRWMKENNHLNTYSFERINPLQAEDYCEMELFFPKITSAQN